MLSLVLAAGGVVPAQAQLPESVAPTPIESLIQMRVEQLAADGMLEIAGTPVSSASLMPRLYSARGYAPTWRSAAQIDGLLELIEDSALEGLDPVDYHIVAVRAARAAFERPGTLTPARRADLDLLLTDSVIRLGYHLRFGKVDPIALDADWNFRRQLVGRDPVATIQAAIDAPSMRAFAAQVIPRGVPYQRLKAALARYREIESAGGWPVLDAGPTLREGMLDPRVPILRERLSITGDMVGAAPAVGAPEDAGDLFDSALEAAVRRFQARHGLAVDGAVGPATRSVLNVPVGERIAQIRANLERARWVFDEFERDYLLVNIAGFHLDLVRAGSTIWSTRVVVGQPFRRTPVFKAEMTYLEFNPTWTVPPTILRQDILPAQRRNPDYLASRSIDVFDNRGLWLDPAGIDWVGQRSFPYRFVQRPGLSNALGLVKFMFPNQHHVYLHDTPSRELFARDARAFSSGCIRVENPFELALHLLGPRWDQARMDALVASGRTERVNLDAAITVLLLYWTTEVSDDGRIQFWPDIYSRDAAVIAGLEAPFVANL